MRKAAHKNLRSKLKKIGLFIFDVDGVLTDNTVWMGGDGDEYKRFNIADGMAVYIARRAGIPTAFVSGRKSKATTARARELKIKDLFQEDGPKLVPFEKLLKKYRLAAEQVAFMGDDVIDVAVMRMAGIAVTVPHAPSYVRRYADIVTKREAGMGAARELVDMVLKAKGLDPVELTYR